MGKQLFVNNMDTTFIANVAASPSTGTPATELDYGILRVNTGAAAFLSNPTGGDYYVLTAYKRSGSVESNIEVMKVTAVDNSVINECRLTVQRAQEGTSAQAYVTGDYVSLRFTAGGAANFLQNQDSRLTAANVINTPAGNIAATTVQAALNELDTEKQAVLVSGTNIKTINGSTLLGSGNLSVGTVTSVDVSGGATGLTFSGGPVTGSGTITLAGTLAIGSGGTGAATQQAAINALAGATTSGYYLRGSGTNVVMAAIQAGDVPTLNQNTTGTASNVTGTVAIANGGTGQTTQQAALNALAAAVTSGFFLRGNGTNVVMAAIQASDVPTLNQNTTGTASNVTGVVAAANGGTGQSSYTSGDLLYASGTTALSKLAGVATGNALISGGTGTAPSWGKIGLTTHVSGTLPVANGGTGVTTSTGSGNLVLSASPTLSGTLSLGVAARISADMSDTSTPTNRLMFQTSTTNGNTLLGLLPNGTSVNTQFIAFGGTDPANAAFGALTINSTKVQLQSSASGTGTQLPLAFLIGSSEVARFSTGGRLLLGSTSDDGSNILQVTGNTALSGLAKATAYQETRVAMGANNLDLSTANYFTKTISGNTTLTVSNVPTSGTAASLILDLTNGGSATITWWSGMKWAGGTAPTLTSSGRDVLGFFTHDGGTTWTGLLLGKDAK